MKTFQTYHIFIYEYNTIIFIIMEYRRKYRQMDDITKQKISQSLKGKSKSFSHVENIRKGLRNYWKNIPNKPTNDGADE